jgi:hypothetical protein
MSDNYFDESRAAMLRSWVLGQMLRGAGFAAVLVFGIGFLLYAIYLVGLLLPEESKQAPAPMPQSHLEQPFVPHGTRLA